MAGVRLTPRILVELKGLDELKTNEATKFILEETPRDDQQTKLIIGQIFPKSDVYSQATYRIEIGLPDGYPFKAPSIRVSTRMYHPNVDAVGQLCVDILNSIEGFKPVTPLTDIVKAVVKLIDHPDLDHALTPEIAAEYLNDRATFDRKARELDHETMKRQKNNEVPEK